MTQEDIIRMAREAGLWPAVTDNFPKELAAFAELVRADEREECAKVCEAEAAIQKESAKFCKVSIDQRDFSICASAIRARGQA